MELRMGMARTSLRPLVWIAVLVCAVALAVVAVYAVTPRPVAHAPGYYITTVSGFPDPTRRTATSSSHSHATRKRTTVTDPDGGAVWEKRSGSPDLSSSSARPDSSQPLSAGSPVTMLTTIRHTAERDLNRPEQL